MESKAVEGVNFIRQRKGESDAEFKKRQKAFRIAMRKRKAKMASGARGSDYK
jgi:hypothetical protein